LIRGRAGRRSLTGGARCEPRDSLPGPPKASFAPPGLPRRGARPGPPDLVGPLPRRAPHHRLPGHGGDGGCGGPAGPVRPPHRRPAGGGGPAGTGLRAGGAPGPPLGAECPGGGDSLRPPVPDWGAAPRPRPFLEALEGGTVWDIVGTPLYLWSPTRGAPDRLRPLVWDPVVGRKGWRKSRFGVARFWPICGLGGWGKDVHQVHRGVPEQVRQALVAPAEAVWAGEGLRPLPAGAGDAHPVHCQAVDPGVQIRGEAGPTGATPPGAGPYPSPPSGGPRAVRAKSG